MCFSQKASKPEPIKPLPKEVDASKKAQRDVRRATAEQSGINSNIFTSALGDANYGTAARKQVTLGTA